MYSTREIFLIQQSRRIIWRLAISNDKSHVLHMVALSSRTDRRHAVRPVTHSNFVFFLFLPLTVLALKPPAVCCLRVGTLDGSGKDIDLCHRLLAMLLPALTEALAEFNARRHENNHRASAILTRWIAGMAGNVGA